MKRLPLIFLLLLGVSFALPAQNVQWAATVVDKSSEYGEKSFAAIQALGKPNVLPNYQASPCAWSPFREQSRSDEFLHVGFRKPMRIKQVAVAESNNPGAVSAIILYDSYNRPADTVYSNNQTRPLPERGRMLRANFPLTSYKVKSVKVVLNTIGMPGWNHIDAIGISDSEAPIQATINVVKDLTFDSQPENLGPAINSVYDEIMPIISPDGKTLYFDRKDHPANTGGIVNDDIWMSTLSGTTWARASNVGSPLNNRGHNFLTAISPDGNTALLGNVYEANGSMSSGLSIARNAENGWAFPKKLLIDNYYNNNKFSEFHLGADGKTIVMTVQRMDSEGGKDLYVSFIKGDGTWTEPKNLGEAVNSAATEMSPFLAADGKTLYFSSDGFSGYGGKDMFMARRLDDSWTKWTEPQNLGPMINSANWDAYYSIPASGEHAYFSSESNSIGKTDIFRIILPEEMRPEPVILVRGKVLDETTQKGIAAKIIYENLRTGEEIGVANSNPRTGEYTIILPAGEKYGFLAQSEDYLSEHQNLDLTKIDKYKEISQDLLLVPIRLNETVVLNNIFFPPSKWSLTPDSKPELVRVFDFLTNHPNIKVEIGGHTNDACSEEFCRLLSTNRARAVYSYLVKKGIPASRVTFKGYGSKQPRYSNATPDGRRKNRRVEFKIIGV